LPARGIAKVHGRTKGESATAVPADGAAIMYMHLFTKRGAVRPADIKQDMLKTMGAILNYIVTDATDSEMFTFKVVTEVFSNASTADIELAIKKLREKPDEAL
jgi:hypothetical protein